MTMTLHLSRASVAPVATGTRKIWKTPCGQYRLSEFTRHCGQRVYYAERLEQAAIGPLWEVISAHRRKQAAVKAIVFELRRRRKPR